MMDEKALEPVDLISLRMPEVFLQRRLYRLKTVCRMLRMRMKKRRFEFVKCRQVRVHQCIPKFLKKWFRMKRVLIEFVKETSHVHRVSEK